MKRMLVFTAALLVLGACFWAACFGAVTVTAQSLPVTKTVAWDANPVSDNVTNYVVRLDGVVIGSPTTTSLPFTITTAGAHTLSVTAVNLWAESAPGVLAFNVIVPGRSSNLVIR